MSDQVGQNKPESIDFCAFLKIQDLNVLAKRHKVESDYSLFIYFLTWILELDRSAFTSDYKLTACC